MNMLEVLETTEEVNLHRCFACRLEQRLATRRARLAELRQQMERERDEQPKKDPEAMKALARVQVRPLDICCSGFSCDLSGCGETRSKSNSIQLNTQPQA